MRFHVGNRKMWQYWDKSYKDKSLKKDCFLFCWAENISTINYVWEVDFFNFFLYFISRFFITYEPYFLTPRKQLLASLFYFGLKILFLFSNNILLLLFHKFFHILASFILSFILFFFTILLELCKSKLDLLYFDLFKLDSKL